MFKKDASIVIADDHPMLLKGLFDELTLNEYNVTGIATNGMQALGTHFVSGTHSGIVGY